ncbi:MAG: leucine-rich repeat protein [Bacteroidales bacterium]|nr:leucine-rich repeat protein [Bacteroidales bacterium]
MSLFLSYSSPIFLDPSTAKELNEHEGGTCDVYLTIHDGRRVLVKKLKPEFEGDPHYVAIFKKEYELGRELKHPNLVVYRDFIQSKEGVMIVLDYVDGLTIEEVLESSPSYFCKSENIERMLNELLACVDYLHKHQVLHLDLKPSNIMITNLNSDVKVLDLGFSYSDTFNTTPGCDITFAAPEQRDKSRYGQIGVGSDLYAIGRILQEIERVTKKRLPRKYRKIMKRCLNDEIEKRPKSAEALLQNMRRQSKLSRIWVVVIGLASTMLYTPWRKALLYAFNNANRSAIVLSSGVQYGILSEEEGTCEVLSWQPVVEDRAYYTAHIASEAVINGKKYKTVAIADSAFMNNEKLRSVYFASTVEHIGYGAFFNCQNLSSIHLPPSVKTIDESAFGSCDGLSSVVLSPNLKILSVGTFALDALESVIIPEGMEVLDKDCLASNKGLKKVKLPSSLKVLGRGVFWECSELEEVNIPEGVVEMGDYVFLRCPNLKDVYNYASLPQDANELFESPKVRVHVKKASLKAYREHPVWGKQTLVADL